MERCLESARTGGGSLVLRMKLSDTNLLEILNLPEYEQALSLFSERKAKKKEIIFPPDQIDDKVIIVKKGRLRVYLTLADKEFTLSILEPGDVFSTHTRAYTQCMDDCVFLVSSTENFRTILMQYPTFAFNVINVLGDLLHNSITIINGLVFKDVTARLAEFLVRMADKRGVAIENGIKLELGLTVEQIAMMVGAARQTVSATVTDLAEAGIISKVEQGNITILDIDRLRKLVL